MSEQRQAGVTLIELLVVLAIIGILTAIGVNMMGGVISKQRLRTSADEIKNRVRAAQMLAVVKNRPVTMEFDATNDKYAACLDAATIGTCGEAGSDDWLDLDTGRVRTAEADVTQQLNTLVEMYGVSFGDAVDSLTFLPPGGLPSPIQNGASYVDGVVCLEVQAEDSGDFDERYEYRRISVNPIVGRAKIWRAIKPYAAQPDCGDAAAWEDES